jgi:hypothetical protein
VTKLCNKAPGIYWFSVTRRHHSIAYFWLGFYIFGKFLHPCCKSFYHIKWRDTCPQIFTASTCWQTSLLMSIIDSFVSLPNVERTVSSSKKIVTGSKDYNLICFSTPVPCNSLADAYIGTLRNV